MYSSRRTVHAPSDAERRMCRLHVGVHELALGARVDLSGVRLVCVDVHLQLELWADADEHVAEDEVARTAVHFDLDLVTVGYAVTLRVRGRHVDVALGADESLRQRQTPLRPFDDDGRRGLGLAGVADRGIDAELE